MGQKRQRGNYEATRAAQDGNWYTLHMDKAIYSTNGIFMPMLLCC
ncbi:hypothetical protein PIPA1_23010 [Pelosinus sp. IPA-1]|nr:hypothetical protein PIPA1_23010 [Pelosinus sp. IPA-1]